MSMTELEYDPMMRVVFNSTGAQRAFRVYRTVQAQPGWITRTACWTFALVIGLPILLLLAAAVILATLVFGGLVLVRSLVTGLRRGLTGAGSTPGRPGDTGAAGGRRNVRLLGSQDSRA